MGVSTSPTVYRLQLGRELRRLREAAGRTREDAAAELECGVSKISKTETGKATLRPAEVRALLDLYTVTDDNDWLARQGSPSSRKRMRFPIGS